MDRHRRGGTLGHSDSFRTDAHDLSPRDDRVWKTKIKKYLWPRLFRLADIVIAPSSGTVALMRSLKIPPDRVMLMPYVAAADAYTGPSVEDAFGIPPLEAMACALPVIVSRQSGISELVTHGEDGYILENPQRPEELATLIARLYENAELGQRLGQKAAETALQYNAYASCARYLAN